MTITPGLCRAARAYLNWTQAELAERAGVGLSTVRDFEREARRPIQRNLEAIRSALVAAKINVDGLAETLEDVGQRRGESDLAPSRAGADGD